MRARTLLLSLALVALTASMGNGTNDVGPVAGSTVAQTPQGFAQILNQVRAGQPLLAHVATKRFRVLGWENTGTSQVVLVSLDGVQLPGVTPGLELHYAEVLEAISRGSPTIKVGYDVGNPKYVYAKYTLNLNVSQRIHLVIITNHRNLILAPSQVVGNVYAPHTDTLTSVTVSYLDPGVDNPASAAIPSNLVETAVELCQSMVKVIIDPSSALAIHQLLVQQKTLNLAQLDQFGQLLGQESACNEIGHVMEDGVYHVPYFDYQLNFDGHPAFETHYLLSYWTVNRSQFMLLS